MEIVPLKKFRSTLGRKKHENMKTQNIQKIDAKSQKPVLKTYSVYSPTDSYQIAKFYFFSLGRLGTIS